MKRKLNKLNWVNFVHFAHFNLNEQVEANKSAIVVANGGEVDERRVNQWKSVLFCVQNWLALKKG